MKEEETEDETGERMSKNNDIKRKKVKGLTELRTC